MRTGNLLLFLFPFFLLGACTPPISYHYRTKETVRETIKNAPAPLSIERDDFTVGQGARGKVDILVIVDNTENFEQALAQSETGQSYFEAAYRRLATTLERRKDLSELDYRLQVFASPSSRSPIVSGSRGESLAAHFQELFDLRRGIFAPSQLYDRRERATTTSEPVLMRLPVLLTRPPFENRSDASLFVTFFSGSDVPVQSNERAMVDTLRTTLTALRSPYRTHWSQVSLIKRPLYRGLDRFFPAANLTRLLEQLSGNSPDTYNLGESDFPLSDYRSTTGDPWVDDVIEKIKRFQRRFFLKSKPFDPGALVVYTDNRNFHSPADYTYQEKTNELIFDERVLASLPSTAIIHASYSLTPPNQDVPNTKSPPPTTVEKSKP